MQKYIYIVVSKTNTALGKIIQRKLGVCYNHCSISLNENLNKFYSFGRKEVKNIFRAGFVHESKNEGFFAEHEQSNIVVVRFAVTKKQWSYIHSQILQFEAHKSKYKYSLVGLFYCYFGIDKKRKNKYFCSQFVAEVLSISGIHLVDKPATLVQPHDFLNSKYGKVVYQGEIGQYAIA